MHFAPIPLEFGADLCAVCILEYLLCRHLLIDLHRCLSVAKNSWVNKFIIYSILPVRSVLVRFDIPPGKGNRSFFFSGDSRENYPPHVFSLLNKLGEFQGNAGKFPWNSPSLLRREGADEAGMRTV